MVPSTSSVSTFSERDAQTSELFTQLWSAPSEGDAQRVAGEIVHLYLDLCTSMANRYTGRGIEHDDLVQVARLALVKALHRYEPGHGPSFAAYAVPTISGELKRWFRDRAWVVRPPRRLQELRADVNAERERLEQELGSTPTDADVAESLGASVCDVREVAVAATGFHPLSLDGPAGDDERPGLDFFLAVADEDLDRADDRVCLSEALGRLEEDERRLLIMRFVDGRTQREIGELLGVSQMQVSRSLRRITERLRELLADTTEPEVLVPAS
jgi:RNA polymerase sigma-B factor